MLFSSQPIIYFDSTDLLPFINKINTFRIIQANCAFFYRRFDHFNGQEEAEKGKPAFNHPIDWTVLDKYEEIPKVMLQTQRGNIKLELLPTIAPGSVINFLKLCEDGFYESI